MVIVISKDVRCFRLRAVTKVLCDMFITLKSILPMIEIYQEALSRALINW